MLLLALAASALADWPPGAEIPGAITADVTPDGFAAIARLVPGFVPSDVPIPDPDLHGQLGPCAFGVCVATYDLHVDGGNVHIAVDSVDIVPGDGALDVQVGVTVSVNSERDPMVLDADAEAIGFIDLNQRCDAWVDPTSVTLDSAVALTLLADGTIDATVPPLEWSGDLHDKLNVDGCLVADIDDVLNLFGLDLANLVIDQIGPQIDAVVASFSPVIEATLDGALSTVGPVNGTVDVLGAPLDYALRPSEVTVAPGGMRIGLSGSFAAAPAPCVERFGALGSVATPGEPPAIGATPSELGYVPQVAFAADDDWMNQGLLAMWETGILCQDLDESAVEDLGLPVALDTGLFAFLAPGAFDDLFPESEPLTVSIAASEPPVASPGGGHDVSVSVDRVDVDVFAEVDGRHARIVGVELAAEAGVDFAFDRSTGQVAVGVALDPASVVPTLAYNELKPDADAAIAGSLDILLGTLVTPLLDDAVGAPTFTLPALDGFGITALDFAPTGNLAADPTGAAGDRLGAFATMGAVSYPAVGCDAQGCDGAGCATSPLGSAGIGGLLAGVVAVRRRRAPSPWREPA